MSFIEELKRRNVFKVGIAYAVTTWILLQLTDVIADIMALPDWAPKLILLILIIGFVPALIFAWAFEMTPDGVKREKDVDRTQSVTQKTGQKLNFVVVGMLVVAAAYFFWESRFKNDTVVPAEAGISQSADASEEIPASAGMTDQGMTVEPTRQSIAVLPFDNRSNREEDEYFTEGIHDDLLTNLARISSLKVISRTSVTQYKDTEKTIPVIAKELGVATIMEGAVQRAGNSVRINVQLIDATTDEHLWAEIFDRDLTTENLFAIQTEIATAIATALEAKLSPQEEEKINRRPTESLAAYNAYLRGRQALVNRSSTSLEKALTEFERAVELDPNFALGWVGIAESVYLIRRYGTLSISDMLKTMEMAVDRALTIDPLLGEAYASKGVIHDWHGQIEEAEAAYLRSIELSPNYATAWHWYFLHLKDRGTRTHEALTVAEKALELAPLSSIIRSDRAQIYTQLGEYERAVAINLEVIELDPEFAVAYSELTDLYFYDLGRFEEALKWNFKGRRLDPGDMNSLNTQYLLMVEVGASKLAESVFRQMEDLDEFHADLKTSSILRNLYDGNLRGAGEIATQFSQEDLIPWQQWLNGLVFAMNDDYQTARKLMFHKDADYSDPEQWPLLLDIAPYGSCDAGWVLMKSGDEVLGRELIIKTIAYIEDDLSRSLSINPTTYAASCYAALGDVEKSIAALETRFKANQLQGWFFLRAWPAMQSVINDARFIELDRKVDQELANQRIIIEAMFAEQEATP